jgi:hypothetical protein
MWCARTLSDHAAIRDVALSLAKIISAPKIAGSSLRHSLEGMNSTKVAFERGASHGCGVPGHEAHIYIRTDEKSAPTRLLGRNGDATRLEERVYPETI